MLIIVKPTKKTDQKKEKVQIINIKKVKIEYHYTLNRFLKLYIYLHTYEFMKNIM